MKINLKKALNDNMLLKVIDKFCIKLFLFKIKKMYFCEPKS